MLCALGRHPVPVTLPLGSGVHGNPQVLADCCLLTALCFCAAFFSLVSLLCLCFQQFCPYPCPSLLPQPSPTPPRYGVVSVQDPDAWENSVLKQQLGLGTPPSSSLHQLPNQGCLIISLHSLFSCFYLSCNLTFF